MAACDREATGVYLQAAFSEDALGSAYGAGARFAYTGMRTRRATADQHPTEARVLLSESQHINLYQRRICSLLFKFTIHLPWDKFYYLKPCMS